jgi:FixJ family two-component response regulator
MNTRTPTAFLVDDEPSVLKALSRLLRSAGINVATFESAREFLEQYDPNAPGCLVVDSAMPEIDGLDFQRALSAKGCTLPFIFLTGKADVPTSVTAMKRGAVDLLTKPANDTDLLATIRTAFETDRLTRQLQKDNAARAGQLDLLTPREREVFEHVVLGKLNKQIAADLGTAQKAIKVHRSRVMEKLKADSAADLVRLSERLNSSKSALFGSKRS